MGIQRLGKFTLLVVLCGNTAFGDTAFRKVCITRCVVWGYSVWESLHYSLCCVGIKGCENFVLCRDAGFGKFHYSICLVGIQCLGKFTLLNMFDGDTAHGKVYITCCIV